MSKRLLIILAVLPTLTLCILAGVFTFAFLNGTIQISFPNATEATVLETDPPATEPPSTESTESALVPVREPANGYIFEDLSKFTGEIAPLTVETAWTGGYYVVVDPIRLDWTYEFEGSRTDYLNYQTELAKSKICFYARAESVVDLLVPLGEYRIYYATGDTWYGEDLLFGPDTQYYRCDETFLFSLNPEEPWGWTLTLKTVANGNLDTTPILEQDFPK